MMSDLEDSGESLANSRQTTMEHMKQLQRLQEKDPEFYQFLKEHDKELLEFNDEDILDNEASDLEEDVDYKPTTEHQTPAAKVITSVSVDSWCHSIKQKRSIGSIKSMLRAFRTACHLGDNAEDGSGQKLAILTSSVFNKIMVFVLNEMDGVLRTLLEAPSTGGKKETILDLMTTKAWKTHGNLMRVYLGNALHILNEMTDEQMMSFTLKRLKASAVFLAAFPVLLRKYIRVVLHTWGTGTGALPVVSFFFLRDLCVRLGSDCLESCLKGVYKAYVMNCKLQKHISRSKLQHINFLGNCISELYGLDPTSAYQHAFLSIRQLAVVLRGAINERGTQTLKGKRKGNNLQQISKPSKKQVEKSYQKVYDWQYLFCLELWTKVICAHNSESDFRPLAYPLTQIIFGMATLVPSARYFPLRLRCVRMLNLIAGATDMFIPVNTILLDMLDMKVLDRPPTGGVGKAVDFQGVKQLDKLTLRTRAFQETCIYAVVEELAEHFAQWSCSVSFFELSFIPLARLRTFCKSTKVDRFRREIRELIRQLEVNCEFTNSRRFQINLSPSDPAAATFLEAEKKLKNSPLLQFVSNLHMRVQHRTGSMVEHSVLVGAESSIFGNKFLETSHEIQVEEGDDGVAAFSSSWMPDKKAKPAKQKIKKKQEPRRALDEDVVEDLVLSSDDDDDDDVDVDVDDDDDDDDDNDEDVHSYGHDEATIFSDSWNEVEVGQESLKGKTKKKRKRKRWDFQAKNKKEMAGTELKKKKQHKGRIVL